MAMTWPYLDYSLHAGFHLYKGAAAPPLPGKVAQHTPSTICRALPTSHWQAVQAGLESQVTRQ